MNEVQDIKTENGIKVSNWMLAILNVLLTGILSFTSYGVSVVSDIRDAVQDMKVLVVVNSTEIRNNKERLDEHINNKEMHHGYHSK